MQSSTVIRIKASDITPDIKKVIMYRNYYIKLMRKGWETLQASIEQIENKEIRHISDLHTQRLQYFTDYIRNHYKKQGKKSEYVFILSGQTDDETLNIFE